MSWQDATNIMVRALINDLSPTSPVHSDDDIANVVATAAIIVGSDFPYFKNSYTIDLNIPEIVPEFSDSTLGTYDPDYLALVTLKASCIFQLGEFQKATNNAIEVVDGDSSVKTAGGLLGWSSLIRLGACQSYTLLINKLSFRKGAGLGRAVSSPSTTSSSAPWGWNYNYGINFFNTYLGNL